MTLKQGRKPHSHQDEKMTSEVDSYPKMLDLTCMIIYSIFLISWTFAYESNVFFYHKCNLMQSFKINSIVGFVVNYLYPVLFGYFGGFLLSKALTGWPLGN